MSFNWAQPAQPSTTGFSFGSSQPAQPATTGFSFGQTSTFGGFGQNTAPAQQAPGLSFGQPSQQPALGATPGQTPAFSFGQPTGGGFSLPGGTPSGFGGLGATPAAPAFPSTTNAFTANPPATPWNSNQNNAFGSGGLSFGTSNPSQQSTGAFGQSVGFGSAPSAPQQQQQQNTVFGGFSGFGQPSQGFGNLVSIDSPFIFVPILSPVSAFLTFSTTPIFLSLPSSSSSRSSSSSNPNSSKVAMTTLFKQGSRIAYLV